MTLTSITVKVREQEIIEGQECRNDRCAVALAINNVLKRGLYASVSPTNIRIYQIDESDAYCSDQQVYFAFTPYSAKDFIHKYDDRQKVEPMEFDLDLPDSLVRVSV